MMVNKWPAAASDLPWCSVVCRRFGVIVTQVMLFGSMPLAFAKAGNSTRLASPCASPMRLPMRSCGLLMLFFFSVTTEVGDLSLMTSVAISFSLGWAPL
jgi:hypothetical protein